MYDYSRLRLDVVPQHYTLLLEPEFITHTFKGRVDIDLNINGGCDKIVLNANKFTYIKVLALTTNTIKRKRDVYADPSVKKSRPCPGRFKTSDQQLEPQDDLKPVDDPKPQDEPKPEDEPKSEDDLQSADDLKPEDDPKPENDVESTPQLHFSHASLNAKDQDEDAKDHTDNKDEKDDEDDQVEENDKDKKSVDEASSSSQYPTKNKNVFVENKGMVLLRSEWMDPESEEEEEEEKKFPEITPENSPETFEFENDAIISSGDEDEDEKVIVSSDEDDLVVNVNDEDDEVDRDDDSDDDSDDVMQVDGADTDSDNDDSATDIDEPENQSGNPGSNSDKSTETVEEMVLSKFENNIDIKEVLILAVNEVIVITTRSVLVGGKYRLSIEFSGVLDDSLRGFYRTKHIVQGEEKWGASCHFEATGARKCFPCFDQPEFRSTFDIKVKRPNKQMEVISNMCCISVCDEVFTFARSPAMPTYLVCVILGYYDSISRITEDGVRVSCYAKQQETKQVEFALDVSVRALKFYKEFFGVAYPLPKMDLVAVPDFYIAAMENWGLITFREAGLMFHPEKSTLARKQYIAEIVCHEIAHMWFGNLVSIEWWDQLWLKEGFATWISFLAVDHMFPEFDIWSDFLVSYRNNALHLDSLENSHPIQVPVIHPAQIDEVFDAISYDKGASIINMLYHWIGEKSFRAGMNRYLVEHKGSSVQTQDLWKSLNFGLEDGMTGVDEVMDLWTTWQGFPKIKVTLVEDKIVLEQMNPGCRKWNLPLRVSLDSGIQTILLQQDPISLTPGSGFPVVNYGQTSFCRVHYDHSLLSRINTNIKTLDVRDRVGLLSDTLSFFVIGEETVETVLKLVELYSGETDWAVVDTVVETFRKLEGLVEHTKAWTGFLKLVYRVLESSLERLGWDSKDGEGNMVSSRSAIINILGRFGSANVGGEVSLLFRREERGNGDVSKDIRKSVYCTAARTGGKREFDYFMKKFRQAERSEEKTLYLSVLSSFTNTSLIQEVLEWSLSEEVKLQDRVFLIISVADAGPDSRLAAWRFFKDKISILRTQYTSGGMLTRLVRGVMKNFNSKEDLHEIKAFFKINDLPGAKRTIDQTIEDVENFINLRDKNKESILRYWSGLGEAES